MTQDVFRRRVFYMPGFDPFPSRRYRELYRSESQEQVRISDYTIAQESLRGTDNFGWRVISAIDPLRVPYSDVERNPEWRWPSLLFRYRGFRRLGPPIH